MTYAAHYEERPVIVSGDDVWGVIEEGVESDPEKATRLLVGELEDITVSSLIDKDDIVSLADDGRLKALYILEMVDERIAEQVMDGRAHFRRSEREAQEALDKVIARYTDRDTAAGHILHWAGEYIELDPTRSVHGLPAIPIEYIEGEWVFGDDGEGDAAAVITYSVEPSPETGHVGWCWWALGKMGDAMTLRDAMTAAERAIQERIDK